MFCPAPLVLVVRGFPGSELWVRGLGFQVRILGFALAFRDRSFEVPGLGVGVSDGAFAFRGFAFGFRGFLGSGFGVSI